MGYQKPSVAFHLDSEDDGLFWAESLPEGKIYLDEDEEDEELEPSTVQVYRWDLVDSVGYLCSDEIKVLESEFGPICMVVFETGIARYLRADFKNVYKLWLEYRKRARQLQYRPVSLN